MIRQRIRWDSVGDDEEPIPIDHDLGTSSAHNEVIYMYLDESGNFSFDKDGHYYFFMTCLVTRRPFSASDALSHLRYDFVEQGLEIEKFHACEDSYQTRNDVCSWIQSFEDAFRVYSISVDKRDAPEDMRNDAALYSKAFEWIVEHVYRNECARGVERAIVITDQLPQNAKNKAVEGALKKFMKSQFQNNGIPYYLRHFASASDVNLQIADYYCWAVQRNLVMSDDWAMRHLRRAFVDIGSASFKEEGSEP